LIHDLHDESIIQIVDNFPDKLSIMIIELCRLFRYFSDKRLCNDLTAQSCPFIRANVYLQDGLISPSYMEKEEGGGFGSFMMKSINKESKGDPRQGDV